MVKLDTKYIRSLLRPRNKEGHKGSYGTLQCIVGSDCYRGASVLSAMGALRSGAGIVRICSVEKACAAVAKTYPSATLLPLADNGAGMISAKEIGRIIEASSSASALLIGCGLGQSADTAAVVGFLLSAFKGGAVVDADALNLIALGGNARQTLSVCGAAYPTRVITPHIGEMSRLTGKSADIIKREPEIAAAEFSAEYGCVTVLKDYRTVIAVPDASEAFGASTYLWERPNSGLAKGGAGDVLAGLIGGFLAQGYSAADSAVLGVGIHGIAAEMCASERTEDAMLPSELGEYICRAFSSISV